MRGGRQGNLHPHLNSSNLATRALEQLGQLRNKLAQFGGNCAIIGGKNQVLLFHLQHTAGTHQGRRGYPFIKPLQRKKLPCFAR